MQFSLSSFWGASPMAAKVLTGTPVSEVPAEVVTDYERDVCQETADALGVVIPDDENIVVL